MRAFALVSVLLIAGRSAAADLPPAPPGVVADTARLFSDADRAKLEALGAQVQRERGAFLRVLTIPDAKGEDPKAIAVRALNQWRVGQKSVLLLVVMNPRSLYLQPGTALASAFDASTSSRICASIVAPQMRAKAYGPAALAGLGAVRDRLVQPPVAHRAGSPPATRASSFARGPVKSGPDGWDAFTYAVNTFHLDFVGGLAVAAWPLFWVYSWVFARKCENCGVRMSRQNRVIEAATFTTRGLGERVFTCGGCGHVETEVYETRKRWGYDSSGDTGAASTGDSYDSGSSSSSSSSDSGSSSDGSGGGGSDF